jgi:hypothetical protein
MLQWLTSKLPWESNLSDPVHVQQQKTKYMDNIPELMKKCFLKTAPPGNVSQKIPRYNSRKPTETYPIHGNHKTLLSLSIFMIEGRRCFNVLQLIAVI